VDIVIIGNGFDASTTANIGGLSVAGVSFVNSETLTGRSPSALPVGMHDVEVVRTSEDGTENAVLAEWFEVFDTATGDDDDGGADDDAGADDDGGFGDDDGGADDDGGFGDDGGGDDDGSANAEESDSTSSSESSDKGGCSHIGGAAPAHLAWLGLLLLGARRRE
jgi:hypothetical protein